MIADWLPDGKRRCPACGYIVHSLPDWHTCPECGVPYDPHSKMYKVHETEMLLGRVFPLAIGSLALLLPLLQRAGKMRFSDLLLWAMLLAGIFVLISGLLRRMGRGSCRVLVNHRGIRFEYPDETPLEVTWQRFGSARYGWLASNLKIWDRNGQQLLRSRDRSIGSKRLRRELAAKLNELAAVYGNA
jgi:hypothetical protein